MSNNTDRRAKAKQLIGEAKLNEDAITKHQRESRLLAGKTIANVPAGVSKLLGSGSAWSVVLGVVIYIFHLIFGA